MALAYFITFTTYGTWLHGTDKPDGSVDRNHNTFGSPFLSPDPIAHSKSKQAMTQPPYLLDPIRRRTVRDALVEFARERDWHLHALHVRSNHVHAVIKADRDPDRLLADLKARASRELARAGVDAADRIRWTRHGSTKHLFTDDALASAIEYTLNEQGERMAYFSASEHRSG
jgi:REP element-mobilizing transposase RayT